MRVLLINLLILLAFSDNRADSFVCPEKINQTPSLIHCCDTLPSRSCQETANELLTSRQISDSEAVIQDILQAPQSKSIVTNCFRTALLLVNQPVIVQDEMLLAGDFLKSLEKDYIEVDHKNLQPQDVLLFDEQGSYKYFEEYETGVGKKFYWVDSNMPLHAAVYLGDGLVIQKENTFSTVITIATLDRTLQVYKKSSDETIDRQFYVQKKTQLILRIFRKKQP